MNTGKRKAARRFYLGREASVTIVRRLLSGTGWALIAKATAICCGLLINAALARILSTSDFGAYLLLVSVVAILANVARFGIKQTLVRLVAESRATGQMGRARATLRAVTIICLVGAVFVSCSFYLFLGDILFESVFSMPTLCAVLGASSVWIAILAFQTPIAETFRGLGDIRSASFLDGVLSTAMLSVFIASLLLVGSSVELEHVVILSLLSAASSLIIGGLLLLRKFPALRGHGGISVNEVLTLSAPLFLTNFANQAMTSASLWVVAAYLPAQDVAVYGAAWKLVSLIILPLLLINMSVQPLISELYCVDDKARLEKALRGSASLAGIPALCVLGAFMFFSDEVLSVVYGPKFGAASAILVALSVGQLAVVATGSCGQVLAFTGHQRALMYITIVSSIVSLAAAVGAAQTYGPLGVAVAVTAGRVIQNFSMVLIVKRLTGMWTHVSVSPAFLKAGIEYAKRATRTGS